MMNDRDGKVHARVRRIAEALNIPQEDFYSDSAMRGRAAEANECLRLWCRIRTPQDRRRALEFLNALVNDEES